MNENHYNSLITLGFVSVSLAFSYFTMRDTEHISGEEVKKETPRHRNFFTLSSIALWLKILVGIQALSLLRTFF